MSIDYEASMHMYLVSLGVPYEMARTIVKNTIDIQDYCVTHNIELLPME